MKNLMPARAIPLLVVLAFWGCVFPSLPKTSAQEITAPSGPLFLAGGRDQDLPNLIRDPFFTLAGAKNAKIVVIPTAIAHADNPKTPDEFEKPWQDLKPLSVQVLHTRERKTADDPAFVKPLTEATAVWFINGHPDRLLKAYRVFVSFVSFC